MKLDGRKAIVLGAGRSGVSTARFLASHGATVALHDRKAVEEWPESAKQLREKFKIGLIGGEIPSWLLDQIDLVVISPGVPTNSIPARYVDRKDGEVIGEVELAYRHLRGNLVAITGSNGKTTTTTLIGEMLRAGGRQVQVGGNIGTPLIDLTELSNDDTWTVAELSSFQLETIRELRPKVALCLNVTPNHLDRYDSFQAYAAAKHRIFMNQEADDVAILNADDEITSSWAAGLSARVLLFSTKRELDEGFFLRGSKLIARLDGSEKLLTDRENIVLKGLHNVENVLASLAAGWASGLSVESMRTAIREFQGVEHRIEFVTEIGGVSFYNDSKATSVDAASKALAALGDGGEGNIVLILGGRGKNAPYSPLEPLIRASVRTLILIGEDAENIDSQLGTTAPVVRASSMRDAVRVAFEAAQSGDAVLLAPACASFDMFTSFEERGRVFKTEVLALGE